MEEKIINNHIREKLYKINELATQFYQEQLTKSKEAQEYLNKRKINNETIQEFRLGYAPSGTELYNYLIEQGYTDEQINQSSLNIEKNIDKFGNRIVLPVLDENNNVVAFGGRTINNEQPKYINSPDNDIFTKSKNLYGLNIAKDFCKEKLILVEGYIDVITLHQAGIKNVVALLGTAITDEQIKLIKIYTNKVILAFDTDLAGKCATTRAIEQIKMFNMNYSTLDYEGAKDLDEYVNKFGTVQEVEKHIKELKQ